jgi:hypothetical protein
MNSKWVFKNDKLKDYVIGSDKKIYKKPFSSHKRFFGYREVKMQYPERYRLNNEWWSKSQLKQHIVLDQNPVVITREDHETPW